MRHILYLSCLLVIIFLYFCPLSKEGFSNISPGVDIKNLKKGQKLMGNMFKYFDYVCRKNDIKYWAIGGTLIGSMRHKGWIPWDGDIDVGMLKSDYERFRIIMKNSIPNNIVFEHRPRNKGCSKLRLLNAHYIPSSFGFHWDDDDGLQLDIFVFDSDGVEIYGNRPVCGRPDVHKRPYSDIFPLQELPFEDILIYVPNQYENISAAVWGGSPAPMLPLKDRFPHEGNIVCNHVTQKMKNKYKLSDDKKYRGVITEYGQVI